MPRRNQQAEDEAYARTLQEEYRNEFIRRESERHQHNGNVNGNAYNTRSTNGWSSVNVNVNVNENENDGSNDHERERENNGETRRTKKKKRPVKPNSANAPEEEQPRRERTSRSNTNGNTNGNANGNTNGKSGRSTVGARSTSRSHGKSERSGRKTTNSRASNSDDPKNRTRSNSKIKRGRRTSSSSNNSSSNNNSNSKGIGKNKDKDKDKLPRSPRRISSLPTNINGNKDKDGKNSNRNRNSPSRSNSNSNGNGNKQHGRSMSHNPEQLQQRRRRRHSSNTAGDEWLSMHHPISGMLKNQQQSLRDLQKLQRQLQRGYQPTVVPMPVPLPVPLPVPPPLLQGRPIPPPHASDSPAIPASTTDADEEYARMVQAEIQYMEGLQQKHARNPNHNQEHQQQQQQERHLSAFREIQENEQHQHQPQPYVDVDADFLNREHQRSTKNSNSNNNSFSNSSSNTTEPLTDYSNYNDDDEAVARRVQQELQDAEYAKSLGLREQQELASQGVLVDHQLALQQAHEHQQQQLAKKNCFFKWAPMVFCICIGIAVPLLYLFDVFDPTQVPFLGDLFGDDWIGNDPWSGTNMTIDMVNGTAVPRVPSNAYGWANTGNGLKLDILNACADDYQPFVQTAIANWDEGSPIDSLTLYSSRILYESECSIVTGKLKICNGDYGDSRWRGLNEVLLSHKNVIVASTAKLNDYYLNFEGDDQKRYTSCHELGHGFGLPHWDEDFFNKDLGNCMDYTQRPKESSKPDDSNFLFLAQLYGGKDVNTNKVVTAGEVRNMVREDPSTLLGAPQVGVQVEEIEDVKVEHEQQTEKNNKDKNKNNRGLRNTQQTKRTSGHASDSDSTSTRFSPRNLIHRGGDNIINIQHDIPFSSSRLLLDADGILPGENNGNNNNNINNNIISNTNTNKRRTVRSRRILAATDDFEVHLIESDEFPEGLILMQHYLLVRDD